MAREPKRDPLHRDNVPGELDNASGEVDEFEAALVRGGDGTTDGVLPDDELERQAEQAAPPARRAPLEPVEGARGPGRLVAFVKASWAELKRVQWPDRRQVGPATLVVLGFVVVAGAYLGVADAAAKAVVDAIL
jgi:preprotein translocase subunit SecE